MDAGWERVLDPDELRWIRRQARAVHVKSFIAAAILTAMLVVA